MNFWYKYVPKCKDTIVGEIVTDINLAAAKNVQDVKHPDADNKTEIKIKEEDKVAEGEVKKEDNVAISNVTVVRFYSPSRAFYFTNFYLV